MNNNKSSTKENSFLKKLGPGLITGAADDDPSGIATYSQAGAQFGFAMLWSLIFSYPLMAAIQIISARIGRISGRGLTENIALYYPRWLLYCIIIALLITNTINIGADIAAMGQALKLVIGGPALLYATIFGVASLLLQIFVPYRKYVQILKWLTLTLLAYVLTLFTVDTPWLKVMHQVIFPELSLKKEYITTLVAIFGTTISPYLFFWQTSQEVEELNNDDNEHPLKKAPQQALSNFKRINLDTVVGMGFSNLVAFSIMLASAIALHAHGITHIQTSADAANALKPVAGNFAFLLFSLGIIGTGLLAIPVLAGSAAYAMADAFKWRGSLELKPYKAKRFYAIIGAATLIGIGLTFTDIDPIQALYWSAVINGILAVPVMILMMIMSNNKKIMGQFKLTLRLRILGWLCTGTMTIAVLALAFVHAS